MEKKRIKIKKNENCIKKAIDSKKNLQFGFIRHVFDGNT